MIQTADRNTIHEMISEPLVLVDFWAENCVPCRLFSRILEETASELPFLEVVKVNITENPETAEEFDIAAFPTVHFYVNGKLVKEKVGLMPPEEIRKAVSEILYF